VTESWRKVIDEGSYASTVFLDLAKAFDCVDHEILLKKLACYGVVGLSNLWFADYLSGRSQQVCFCSKLSEPGPVVVGVLQGSILGPLLFSIYINDLPHAVSFCDADQYADDTLISYSNPSFSIYLQNDVNSIVNWLIANKLWINVSKTEAMIVGSCQRVGSRHLSVVIDNKPLHNVYVAKYLGV